MSQADTSHKGVSMPEINTKFLFTIALEIQVSNLGDTPYGRRRIFHFDAGSFEGPKLKGRVLPGGGGWSLIRRDDVMEVDVRLVLETDGQASNLHGLEGTSPWAEGNHGPRLSRRDRRSEEPTISGPRPTSRQAQTSTAGSTASARSLAARFRRTHEH